MSRAAATRSRCSSKPVPGGPPGHSRGCGRDRDDCRADRRHGGPDQVGSGTLILTADNAYGGGTTIAGGTLQIGSGGTSGSVAGGIVNNGQLVFFRSDTATVNPGGLDVANAVSGAGMVTFRGTGLTGESAYTLSGDNSAFAGMFEVLSGARLSAAGPTGLGGATVVVRNGGTMLLTAGPAVSNTFIVAGNGWTEPAGQLGALRLDGGATIAGNVILTGQTRIGTSVAGQTGEIAGVVGESGGSFGIDKVGLGRLRLAAVNTYTGPTTVTKGRCRLASWMRSRRAPG